MNAVFERTGGFASSMGRLARNGLSGLARAAQDRAAEQKAQVHLEQDALADAVRRLSALAVPVYASYRPQTTQDMLDAVSWQTPAEVEKLLRAECVRIRKEIEPLIYKAGFQLDTKDQLLRRQMTAAFCDVLRPLHRKAFGDLRLPPFFDMRKGLIDFEDTYISTTKSFFSYPYVGVNSGYRYLDSAERPSFGFQ